MHSSYPIVLLLILITIVAARSSNTGDVSYLKALKRRANVDTNYYMLKELILRNKAEDRAMKRKNHGSYLILKVLSAAGDQTSISVPLPSGPDVCLKHSSGRGVGTLLITICNADEEKYGTLCYPKCRDGYKPEGCCICSPSCSDGMNDIGISCGKRSYSRGVGHSRLTCTDNKEEDAALCYNKCRSGYYGVGPVCWQSCSSSTPYSCGIMCTKDKLACTKYTLSIVKSALEDGFDFGIDLVTIDPVKIAEGILEIVETVINVVDKQYC